MQISWKAVRCVRPPQAYEKFVDLTRSGQQTDCSSHHEIQLFIYLPRTKRNALLAPLLRAHLFCLLNLLFAKWKCTSQTPTTASKFNFTPNTKRSDIDAYIFDDFSIHKWHAVENAINRTDSVCVIAKKTRNLIWEFSFLQHENGNFGIWFRGGKAKLSRKQIQANAYVSLTLLINCRRWKCGIASSRHIHLWLVRYRRCS